MDIDLRTLSLVIGIACALQSGMLISLALLVDRYPGVGGFALGFALIALGFILPALPLPLQDPLVTMALHTAFVTGTAIAHAGIRLFAGRTLPLWSLALPVAVALGLILYFTAIDDDVEARMRTSSAAVAILSGWSALLLATLPAEGFRVSARFLAAACAMVASFSAVHVLGSSEHVYSSNGSFGLTPIAVTEYLIVFCLAMTAAIGFLLMVAQRAIHELTGLAQVDHLTGALNRLGMTERLDRAHTAPPQGLPAYSVILLDIDRFKDVNDTYGHNAGDAVLTELASRVAGAIRSNDSLARYGGEEFLVLLPDTDLNEATQIGERLRRIAEERPAVFGGRSIPFTLSVGVAASGPVQRGRTSVIMDADAALYRAKREGRNRVVVAQTRSAATSIRGACLTS